MVLGRFIWPSTFLLERTNSLKSAKKPRANLSDHIRMAVRIEIAKLAMESVVNDILQYHSRNDAYEMRTARRAIDNIDKLRSHLDGIVCHYEPDGIADWCTHVYYGDWTSILRSSHSLVNSVFDWIARVHADILERQSGIAIHVTGYDSSSSEHYNGDSSGGYSLWGLLNSLFYGFKPREYALTPDQIRDFCKEASESGHAPTDDQVDNCVSGYAISTHERVLSELWDDVTGDVKSHFPDCVESLDATKAVSLRDYKLVIAVKGENNIKKLEDPDVLHAICTGVNDRMITDVVFEDASDWFDFVN